MCLFICATSVLLVSSLVHVETSKRETSNFSLTKCLRSKYWTSLSISTVHRLFRRIMETNIVYFLQTGGNQPKIHKPGNAQQAFFGHVTQGLTSVRSARDDLETSADLPPLGNDPVSLRLRRILNFTRVRRLIDKSKKKKTPIRNEG